MRTVLCLACLATVAAAQSWVLRETGTKASLRGLSALNARIVWASGTGGTYLSSTDGGQTWTAGKVPDAASLDFRDIQAVSPTTVYLLSSGTGDKARIYKTTDGGHNWNLLFTNPDAKGFFDALAFWDAGHGVVVGDPVDGHFVILTTSDGGRTWQRRKTPDAMAEEGAFAASGTCLITRGKNDVWLGTGGPHGARIFHSADRGTSWTVVTTPIRKDSASTGIFSLAFSDARHGVAVGGDYRHDQSAEHNIAVTSDGGRTWTEPAGHPSGFRSAVAYLPEKKAWVATGTSGSDISLDGGSTWKQFDSGSFNSLALVSAQASWAAGGGGRVAALQF